MVGSIDRNDHLRRKLILGLYLEYAPINTNNQIITILKTNDHLVEATSSTDGRPIIRWIRGNEEYTLHLQEEEIKELIHYLKDM